MNKRIGIIGVGHIGEALAKGLLKAELIQPQQIIASRRSQDKLEALAAKIGIGITTDNLQVVNESDVIVLAVPPIAVERVLNKIREAVADSKLVISLALGITLDFIEKIIPDVPVIRAVPNVCCAVQQGCTILCNGSHVSEKDVQFAEDMWSVMGKTVFLEESLLDAAIAVCGSGPAYLAVFIEALTGAGVSLGLPRDISMELALEGILGAVQMLKNTGEHPVMLQEKIATPGGGTIAGLKALERSGFRAAVMDAVEIAATRFKELAKANRGFQDASHSNPSEGDIPHPFS